MLPVAQHLLPIHKHVLYATRVVVRMLERGVVLNRLRVEDHNVREVARRQLSAPRQAKIGRGQRRKPPNRFLQRQDVVLTNVPRK